MYSHNNKISKKNKLIEKVKNFKSYKLPSSLNFEESKLKNKIQSEIYRSIFLDKKRVNDYPRYIYLKNIGKPSIREIKDFNLLNEVIYKILN